MGVREKRNAVRSTTLTDGAARRGLNGAPALERFDRLERFERLHDLFQSIQIRRQRLQFVFGQHAKHRHMHTGFDLFGVAQPAHECLGGVGQDARGETHSAADMG